MHCLKVLPSMKNVSFFTGTKVKQIYKLEANEYYNHVLTSLITV